MNRHGSIGLGGKALLLLALLAVGAPTAFAKTWKCMVINDRINTTYLVRWPDSMNPVQDAIDEAAPWDKLWIRGECPGTLEITKSLTLEGQEVAGFRNAPTIRAKNSTYGNINNVVHVSGSGVQVQINSLILTGGGNSQHPVEYGGGILNEQAELTLNNVTITGNYAYRGGGIYNDSGTVELNGSTIDWNFAGSRGGLGSGGGIYTNYGTVILNASTITRNQWTDWGGGIYARAATVIANESEIAYNFTVTDNGQFNFPKYGGGIYMSVAASEDPWNTLTLTDTVIHDNWVTWAGGGIWAKRADVTLAGTSELSENHADSDGGGANVVGNLVLSGDTTIHDNDAIHPYYPSYLSGNGGGVAFRPLDPTDRLTMSGNATIYDNRASLQGGGIDAPRDYLINCISGNEGEVGVNVFDNFPNNVHSW